MRRHDIPSRWITGPRRVTVWTPWCSGEMGQCGNEAEGQLEPPNRRTSEPPNPLGPLPLLVLHDGQNLFDPDRAHRPGHTWQVAETASRLVADGRIPPLAIAGIDHAADDRILELTPTEGRHPGAGQVWRYGRFIVEELVPALEREYSLNTTAGNLALGGSSLGGLATLAIALQYPARFGRLLVMSPSLWWDDTVMLKRVQRQRLAQSTRVWVDAGLNEGRWTATHVRRLKRLLIDQLESGNVGGVQDPDGDHSEDSWSRRLPAALTWLYGDTFPSVSGPLRRSTASTVTATSEERAGRG